MAISQSSYPQQAFVEGQPTSSLRYDLIAALLSCLGVVGAYLDLWAHTHIPQLETFFTPWHGVLYSSFLLYGGFLVATAITNHNKGYSWLQSMPRGYGLALVGVFIYGLGGIGDMCWHLLFGIEKNIEALLSPTHLTLALGSFLMKTGPLRAAWQRDGSRTLHRWKELTPALLSLFCMLAGFMFYTWYANPFAIPVPAITGQMGSNFLIQGLGVASIFLQTALLIGPVLLIVRRWVLPFGALTLVFTLTNLVVSVPQNTYFLLPVAILGGLGADLLLKFLKPTTTPGNAFHLFAFAVPVVLYLLYFLELAVVAGISWTIHMWMGSIVLAGIVSLLLSYLLQPPRGASEEK